MYRVIHQIEIYLVDSTMGLFNNWQIYRLYTQKGTTSCMAEYIIEQVDHAFREWIGRTWKWVLFFSFFCSDVEL